MFRAGSARKQKRPDWSLAVLFGRWSRSLLRAASSALVARGAGIGAALHAAGGLAGAAFVACAADGEGGQAQGKGEGFDELHKLLILVCFQVQAATRGPVTRWAGGQILELPPL